MFYPKKINAKKTEFIIKVAMLISVLVGILLVVINKFTTPNIHWAGYCNAGIIYIWITVLYSINKNVNIANHLFTQMVAISLLSVYIDYKMGFKAWSINVSIPIIIIIINIVMAIISISCNRKYMNYVIYQLLITMFSSIPLFLIYENLINDKTLSIISTSISGANLLISLILHFQDIKDEIIRKFHV